MKHIKYFGILLFALICVSCLNSSTEQTTTSEAISPELTEKKWYAGGNLHKAKISEWKVATDENKLATCADFVANIKQDLSLDELRVKSEEMKTCIDEATRDLPATSSEKTIEIAATCAILMGY